jgi:RimJ/RimL family protein N-acetyltransferase
MTSHAAIQHKTVRLLTPDDAAAYVSLRRQMLVESPWAFGASPESDSRSDVARVASSIGSPGVAYGGGFVADSLASVAVMIREEKPKRSHIAGIYSVYTRPDARGRGLCRSVLNLLIEHARTWPGLERIQLSVSERSPAAKALYESLGFQPWGREPDALRIDGEAAAEIHMSFAL